MATPLLRSEGLVLVYFSCTQGHNPFHTQLKNPKGMFVGMLSIDIEKSTTVTASIALLYVDILKILIIVLLCK